MSLDVEINSKQYSLVPSGDGTKISTRPVQQFVQPIRDTGRTRPEDVAAYESFVVPNLAYGFGRARVNSDVAFDPKEYRRFFNSTCDTRWMDRIYLPILSQNSVQTGLDVVKCSTSFKGELNSLWSTTTGAVATSRGVANRQFTGDVNGDGVADSGDYEWENGGLLYPAPGVQSLGAGADLVTYNKAMTVPAGTTLLVVVITYTDGSLSTTLTNVGYNAASNGTSSTAMTELYKAIDGTVGIGIFYVFNPTIASDKYFTARMDDGNAVSEINAVAYTVRAHGGVVATATSTDTSGTAVSTSLTTVAGDFVVDGFASDNNIAASSSGANQTSGLAVTGASIAHSHKSSYKNATTTSTTMSHTLASSMSGKLLHAVGRFTMASHVPVDITSDSGNLVAMVVSATNHQTHTSTDGASWTESTTPITNSLLTTDRGTDFGTTAPVDAGLFATIGGELIACLWDEDSSSITFFRSTNGGVAWADEAIDIPSANGPQGVAVYPDIDGEDKLYVATNEGLYIVDTSPSTWTYQLIMPMPNSTHNGRRMTIHEGSLWFAQGVDNDSPAPIYKLTVQGNSRIIESGFGLSYGDGVPSDMLGPVRWMVSSGDQLFISIGGGAASRNARILAWNGKGWHHMYKNASANQPIDWIDIGSGDDGTPRLHYSMRTGTSTCDAEFLEQPLVNPRSGVSIKRAADGQFIELPYYDLGMPHESKNFLSAHLSADDLTASHEIVEFHYGLNGADRDTVDLGDFTSAVSKLQFASGAGVSAKDIGILLKLNRNDSTNTNTPKIKDIIIEGLVVPTILYEHQMTIDLQQTAEETGQSVETVISNIETLVESVIQTQAKFGQVSKYVTLDRERSAFSFQLNSWDASGAPNSMADRTGTFNCVLVEKVAE